MPVLDIFEVDFVENLLFFQGCFKKLFSCVVKINQCFLKIVHIILGFYFLMNTCD